MIMFSLARPNHRLSRNLSHRRQPLPASLPGRSIILKEETKWLKSVVPTAATLPFKTTRRWSSKAAQKPLAFKPAVRTAENLFSSSPSKTTCSTSKIETSFFGCTSYCFRYGGVIVSQLKGEDEKRVKSIFRRSLQFVCVNAASLSPIFTCYSSQKDH